MKTQELAWMMLDRLGVLASTYCLGDEALAYLESIRRELRPIAWPHLVWTEEGDEGDKA